MRQIKRQTVIGALVCPCKCTVDKYLRAIICAFYVQKIPLVRPFIEHERSLIPDIVTTLFQPDSGRFALIRKRNKNIIFLLEPARKSAGLPCPVIIQAKAPFAV